MFRSFGKLRYLSYANFPLEKENTMNKHNTISQQNLKYFYKPGRLPHLFDVDKPIFITFRLKFTLPQNVINEYETKKRLWHEEQVLKSDYEKKENN